METGDTKRSTISTMPHSLVAILFCVIFFSQDIYCAGGKHGHSESWVDPTTGNPDNNTNSNSNSHEGRNMTPRNNETPTTSQTIMLNQQQNTPTNQQLNYPMNQQQRSQMINQQINSLYQYQNHQLNLQQTNPMNQHQNRVMNQQQRNPMNQHQIYPVNNQQNNPMNQYQNNHVTIRQIYPVSYQRNNPMNQQQNNVMNQQQSNPINQNQNNLMKQYLGNQVPYQQTYPVNQQQRSQITNQQNIRMQQFNNFINQFLSNYVTQQPTYPVNSQQNTPVNNLVNHQQNNQLSNQQNNQMNQLHLDHTDMVISCSSLNLIPPDPNMIPTGIDTSSVSHCNGTKAYKTCPIKCRKGYGPVLGGIEAVCRQNGTWGFCHGGMCIPTEIVTTGFIRQTHEAKHNAYIPDSLRDIIQDFYAPIEDEVIFSLTAKPLESDTLEALKAFLSTDKPSDGELYLQRVNSELGDGNTDAEYYCSVDMEMSSDDNMTHILFTLSNWYYEDYEENFILGEIANSIRNNVSFSWNTNHENLPALRTFMENVQEITLYFWNNSVQMAKHTDDSGNDCSIEAFRYSNSGNVYLAFDPIK
eukprot:120690_1